MSKRWTKEENEFIYKHCHKSPLWIQREMSERFGITRPLGAIKRAVIVGKKQQLPDYLKPIVKFQNDLIIITLICTACGKKWDIRTNDPLIYTEDVLKTWRCPLCL